MGAAEYGESGEVDAGAQILRIAGEPVWAAADKCTRDSKRGGDAEGTKPPSDEQNSECEEREAQAKPQPGGEAERVAREECEQAMRIMSEILQGAGVAVGD